MKSLSRIQLWDPMDCSLPGSSVHGIFQARILEWLPFPSPIEEISSPQNQQKSLKCSAPKKWCDLKKWQNDLGSFSRQTTQHHCNPSLCFNHQCQRSSGWSILWRPRRPPRTNTKRKDVLLIIEGWNAKVGSQEISGVTGKLGLGVQNKAEQRFTEFCQENALAIANTFFQQHKKWLLQMIITKWSIWKPDWLHSLLLKMEKLYTESKNKTQSWFWLRLSATHSKIQA